MPTAFIPASLPVRIDEALCIADKGCTVCIDVCPLDVLAIDLAKGKAYMKFDECWYCMPCGPSNLCPGDGRPDRPLQPEIERLLKRTGG